MTDADRILVERLTALRQALAINAGILRCIAQRLPEGEQALVNFTGQWAGLGAVSIAAALDLADDALGEPCAEAERAP